MKAIERAENLRRLKVVEIVKGKTGSYVFSLPVYEVKINSAMDPTLWYSKRIGEVIRISELGGTNGQCYGKYAQCYGKYAGRVIALCDVIPA